MKSVTLLRQDTDRVRDASDIVAVLGEYVKLRLTGSGRYVGLCPFHQEKTPSFTVNLARQRFKCFGCGAGGDVFAFIQQIEGVGFHRAKEALASRAGVPLAHEQLTAAEKREYARRRAAAAPLAAGLAQDVADWERGLELFLIHDQEAAAAETEVLLELGMDPAERLLQARSKLIAHIGTPTDSLVRTYRATPESERRQFRETGRADREDAEQITHAIVDLLAEAERRPHYLSMPRAQSGRSAVRMRDPEKLKSAAVKDLIENPPPSIAEGWKVRLEK